MVDSNPLLPSSVEELQIPELSNTLSSSRRIWRASLIFLMFMNSIVFSILSDACASQLEFLARSEACFTFMAEGVGVIPSDCAGDCFPTGERLSLGVVMA